MVSARLLEPVTYTLLSITDSALVSQRGGASELSKCSDSLFFNEPVTDEDTLHSEKIRIVNALPL